MGGNGLPPQAPSFAESRGCNGFFASQKKRLRLTFAPTSKDKKSVKIYRQADNATLIFLYTFQKAEMCPENLTIKLLNYRLVFCPCSWAQWLSIAPRDSAHPPPPSKEGEIEKRHFKKAKKRAKKTPHF